MSKPFLLFTIDVEEDMPGWQVREPSTVANVSALPRLAEMCSGLGIRPTYMCTYPVVTQRASSDLLRRLYERGNCEIATHMHAWNTPPFRGVPGRQGDERLIPYYQFELGPQLFHEKLESLHAAITAVAGREPTSYRAGRFGIDHLTLRELLPFGYQVDSSITPLEEHLEDEGPDFRRAPQRPYRPAREDVIRVGDLPILEIPVSVGLTRCIPEILVQAYVHLPKSTRLRGLLSRDYLRLIDFAWLYPVRFELEVMQRVARILVADGNPVLNVFLHSSELFAGTSGRIHTQADLDVLYARMEGLFEFLLGELGAVPATLAEAGRALAPSLGLDFQTKRSG